MKNILYLLLLLSYFSFGQTLNGIPIGELDAKYIEIVGTSKFLKFFEVTIAVNYGQIGDMRDAMDQKSSVLDENGKPYPFNGMMGVVNFFADRGYKLEFTYPINHGNSNVYHYIMVKEHNPEYKRRFKLSRNSGIITLNTIKSKFKNEDLISLKTLNGPVVLEGIIKNIFEDRIEIYSDSRSFIFNFNQIDFIELIKSS